MADERMDIDAALARRLVSAQFPEWVGLPVNPVEEDGWDNMTFRLGEGMSVRLPSGAAYEPQVEREHRWLPRLAPFLPLPIPEPLAKGIPGEGYPFSWSVYRWIEGEAASVERVSDMNELATMLADFLAALRRVPSKGGPPPGQHNFFRGDPLSVYDGETRRAIYALGGEIGAGAATAVWEKALASSWREAPVWFHGDVAPGNLLVEDGRLCAVIDFGASGIPHATSRSRGRFSKAKAETPSAPPSARTARRGSGVADGLCGRLSSRSPDTRAPPPRSPKIRGAYSMKFSPSINATHEAVASIKNEYHS